MEWTFTTMFLSIYSITISFIAYNFLVKTITKFSMSNKVFMMSRLSQSYIYKSNHVILKNDAVLERNDDDLVDCIFMFLYR